MLAKQMQLNGLNRKDKIPHYSRARTVCFGLLVFQKLESRREYCTKQD